MAASTSRGRQEGLRGAWPSLRFDDAALEVEFTTKQFRACVPACITLSALHVISHIVTLIANPPDRSSLDPLVAQTFTGVFALLSHAYSHSIESDVRAHTTFVRLNELNVVWMCCFLIWFGYEKRASGVSLVVDSWIVGLEGFVFFAVSFAMHLLVFPPASRFRIYSYMMLANIVIPQGSHTMPNS